MSGLGFITESICYELGQDSNKREVILQSKNKINKYLLRFKFEQSNQ